MKHKNVKRTGFFLLVLATILIIAFKYFPVLWSVFIGYAVTLIIGFVLSYLFDKFGEHISDLGGWIILFVGIFLLENIVPFLGLIVFSLLSLALIIWSKKMFKLVANTINIIFVVVFILSAAIFIIIIEGKIQMD